MFFEGISYLRGEGRGAQWLAHIRYRFRASLSHVAYEAMPLVNSSLLPSANHGAQQQYARSDSSFLNKLVWLLIWERLEVVSHGFLGCQVGGREAIYVLIPNLFRSSSCQRPETSLA
jgi:hypothetical protein